MPSGRPRPWEALYPPSADPRATGPDTMLHAWERTVDRHADDPCVHYLDATLTFADVDRAARTLAADLAGHGTAPGDRVGLYLQNDPQWLVGMVASWLVGAIPVALNPMLKGQELVKHLDDAGARVLLCQESLHRDVVVDVLDQVDLDRVITTHPLDLAPTAHVPEPLRDAIGNKRPGPGAHDLAEILAATPGPLSEVAPTPDDVAVITYTSGTTGRSKGAMNLHRGMSHSAQVYVDWFDLHADGDVILGIAPLFHITGIVAGMGVTILSGAPLVLTHRFDPATALDVIEQRRCTFTVATTTAYIALANEPSASQRDLSSLQWAGSGGAAISPATVERVHEATGLRILPIYGLTETTSPTHLTPPGATSPVDPASGALAVGVPVPGADVQIVDDGGKERAPGEPGEVIVRGPMVVPGYWQLPDETAHAIRDGWLYTGDIGVMDADGWLFVVDRKKDLINAGGYKIWPREVEDVLYQHPAVKEAVVVGVSDDYRGESVKAVVSLATGAQATEDELITFCRDRLAAYKYPRVVEFRDELPKTLTGKLLRREVR